MFRVMWNQEKVIQVCATSQKVFVGLGKTFEFTVGLTDVLVSLRLSSLPFALLILYPSEGLKLLKVTLILPLFPLTFTI